MKKRKQVSAIVPVFNEEKTVSRVVKVLLASKLINEVVVVNDGSTDKSQKKLEKFRDKIVLISVKKNQGKGWALVAGIKKAKHELVMFVDADLVNLHQKYLAQLIEPVVKYHWRGAVGVRKKGKILPAPFARLSGERIYYKKDLLPHLENIKKSRFGVEVLLNHVFRQWPIKKLNLLRLKALYKYEKWSLTEAVKEYLNEGVEIAKELARQEKLIPADVQIIEKLKEAVSLEELKLRISRIKNKKIKLYLEEYILKYLKQARGWFSKS